MRFILLLVLLVFPLSAAQAGDEFGARFGGDRPSAFDDPSPENLAAALALDAPVFGDSALDLQAIEPASGEAAVEDGSVQDKKPALQGGPLDSQDDVKMSVPFESSL